MLAKLNETLPGPRRHGLRTRIYRSAAIRSTSSARMVELVTRFVRGRSRRQVVRARKLQSGITGEKPAPLSCRDADGSPARPSSFQGARVTDALQMER